MWKKIRRVLKQMAPYQLVINRMNRGKDFIRRLDEYQRDRYPIPKEENKFKNVFSIQGFGYSGSGAVVDLLREYDSTTVLGNVDPESSVAASEECFSEIDIIRHSGGFLEIERFLDSNNGFFNDALLRRTAKLFEHSLLYQRNEEIKKYLVAFFDSLMYLRLSDLSGPHYNTYLRLPGEKGYDIFLKRPMSIAEFRDSCRNLLNVIFNRIPSDTDFLVLDQLFSDGEFDMERNEAYVPNLKTVFSVRDPRDVYAFGRTRNVEWIPHESVDDFIAWYKMDYKNAPPREDSDKYHVVRYENLVLEYDREVPKIERYLGLDPKGHERPFSCFDPKVSRKYVGLYKGSPVSPEDVAAIEGALPEYCNALID